MPSRHQIALFSWGAPRCAPRTPGVSSKDIDFCLGLGKIPFHKGGFNNLDPHLLLVAATLQLIRGFTPGFRKTHGKTETVRKTGNSKGKSGT
jgi:hypothetical protein